MTAFFTVFLSVFLAELGDKTRLATALFAADGDGPKWLVFLASSAVLVASAGIATIAGSMARDFVGGPMLRLVAGAGLIVIGVLILWGALKPA